MGGRHCQTLLVSWGAFGSTLTGLGLEMALFTHTEYFLLPMHGTLARSTLAAIWDGSSIENAAC